MRVSAKSDYALRALVHLAVLYKGAGTPPISIRTLAEANDIPKRFLEHIMIELRQCGWVLAMAGRGGGFILAKRPEEITMGQVVRYFDDVLAPIECVSKAHYRPCNQEHVCRFRQVFKEIRNFTAARMDEATLAKIINSEPPVVYLQLSVSDFRGGDGI